MPIFFRQYCTKLNIKTYGNYICYSTKTEQKERNFIDYTETGVNGLSKVSNFLLFIAIIAFIASFFSLVFTIAADYRDEAYTALGILIGSLLIGIKCLIYIPFVNGFKTIVKNSVMQNAKKYTLKEVKTLETREEIDNFLNQENKQ